MVESAHAAVGTPEEPCETALALKERARTKVLAVEPQKIVVAFRIESPAAEHLRPDRRAAGRAQDARRRARGPRRALGRAEVRDVPARAEVPVRRAPIRLRQGALQRTRHAREDWEARQRAAIANWNCFGAPAALFCYIDRTLGPPQWADVGMYLQIVMLLLRAEGLHSCPQMAWSQVRETVAEVLSSRTGSSSSAACRSGTRTPRGWGRQLAGSAGVAKRRRLGLWGPRAADPAPRKGNDAGDHCRAEVRALRPLWPAREA